MTHDKITGGSPLVLGAHHDGEGVNFAVFSEHAAHVELCLFSSESGNEIQRIRLPERSGPVWHGHVAGLAPGALYGYRAHGPFDPEHGHRFNANKLLMDPYAREFRGSWTNAAATLGYQQGSPGGDLSFDTRDSAPFVPKSVVSDAGHFSAATPFARGHSKRDLIYEAHVKGLTQQHPDVADDVRGTFEGLASEPVIDHLQKLGVRAIELLPVHSIVDEAFLVNKGLTNYWGYNTIGFFAPEPRYFGPAGVAGFRRMVERFHAADIEVILDVVYNHTAEGNHLGPTLCYRGLDNASYYRLVAGQPRYYVNDTGVGNTLNISHPYVLRMVMDSLRFWVEIMGVDGFRFDLATTLGRENHGFDAGGSFFDALRQDPVLSGVRLIAEPWDVGPGGYRLGGFPHDFSEWNDTYRDTVRRYWRDDAHSAQELGARLLGSADVFEQPGRRPSASVNFVSAHDGFTLADTTRYNRRHNEANLENNQDGHQSNYSDNCGVEGDTDDPDTLAKRARRQRNMLATLFFSQGTPMLLAGDEISNSQQGNNNSYCQDNEIGWVNWDSADADLLDFVSELAAFRRSHRSLRQRQFLHGAERPRDGLRDVEWTDFSGQPLQWRDPGLSNLCIILRCSAEAPDYVPDSDVVFIAFNRTYQQESVTLPPEPKGFRWQRGIDTAVEDQKALGMTESGEAAVAPRSVAAFVLKQDRQEP